MPSNDELAQQHRREVLDILARQLERMRGMLYGYYSQFFQAIHLFTVLILAIVALSLLPQMRALILALPFFVIYAGSFCAYLITYNFFARIYAAALEQRINSILGEEVLVAHRMEDVFIYKPASPKFVAFDLTAPSTAISAITVSYTLAGIILIIIGAYRAVQLLPGLIPRCPLLKAYWPTLIVWGLLHLVYLLWYFLTAKQEKQIDKIVRDAYGL